MLSLVLHMLCTVHGEQQSADNPIPSCNLTAAPDSLVAASPGSLVIAGLFDMRHFDVASGKCVCHEYRYHNIQKAVLLRYLVDEIGPAVERDFNLTLGYEIHDTCSSHIVAGHAATRISLNEKVVGVAGVDYKDFLKQTAMQTTAYSIPTFIYIYNDEELMDPGKFPTLYSLTDSEAAEAGSIIQFLNAMSAHFMDIWYHPFSQLVAEYIYQNYTLQGGCGRLAQVYRAEDVDTIGKTLDETGGEAADVQLILSNSIGATKAILQYMVDKLGFRDKLYILGYSVGREQYLDEYRTILNFAKAGNSMLLLPIPDLSSSDAEISSLDAILNRDWTEMPKRDLLDDLYTETIHLREKKGLSFIVSNWSPHIIGGFHILMESLLENLDNVSDDAHPCLFGLRQSILSSIVKPNRTFPIDNAFLSANLALTNRTLSTGYKMGIYKSYTDSYETLGRTFSHSISITNSTLMQEMVETYKQECSETCHPGFYRLYEEQNLKYLPCCWKCVRCPVNFYSKEEDKNFCTECSATEVSTPDSTGCVNLTELFIQPGSPLFLIGSSFAPCGFVMIVVCVVIIVVNEQRPVIKASDPVNLYTILFSLTTGYAASFLPLIKPSPVTCKAEYFGFVIFATLITVNLLFKCMKIYQIFIASKDFRRPRFAGLLKRNGLAAINIGTLIFNTMLVVADSFYKGGLSWEFTKVQDKDHYPIHLFCNVSRYTYLLPWVIPSLSFLATLWLAVKMRHFPHNFRETLNIFAATFIVLLCSVMFMGGYSLSPSSIRSFLRCLVLQITATAFLTCLFIPKIVVLLRRNADIEEERKKLDSQVKKFASAKSARSPTGTGRVISLAAKLSSDSIETNIDRITNTAKE